MARVEPIEYLETGPRRKDPVETYVRISTVLRDYMVTVYEYNYGIRVLRKSPVLPVESPKKVFYKVLADIPVQKLKLAERNYGFKYKKAYRLIWE